MAMASPAAKGQMRRPRPTGPDSHARADDLRSAITIAHEKGRPMRTRSALAVPVAILLAACGSDGPTGPAPLANGTYSARIDGGEFNAMSAAVIGGAGGLYSLGGGNAAGQTIGFAWLDVGPGTYVIGGAATTIASHTHSGQTWSASTAQGSGSIVVTTSTSTRVAGTFSFVLPPDAASGATGTRTITQGVFDLTY